MADLDIQIDEVVFRIPPKSQTIETADKRCQPGIFYKDKQTNSLIG